MYTGFIALILIQFIQIKKTNISEGNVDLFSKYAATESVKTNLKQACYDCHSNETVYPWYTYIQPVGWWIQSHFNGGKRKLNYSTLANRRIALQNHKFEEMIEFLEAKKMPIPSYTYFGLHPEAKLSDAERLELIDWAKTNMAMLRSVYPADSLVLKKR